MNWSNYGKWRHPEQWNKLNNMDKITEQLIRIETKLEMLLMMAKAKNASKEKQQDELKELISQDEYNRRRDKMAEDMANR